MTQQSFWTAERFTELLQLRSDGDSFSKAANCLGCTKNAAIGKMDRYRNPHRPRARDLYRPAEPTPNPFGEHHGCLWPYDHPDNPNFHFCGAPKVPGKPYCSAHAAIAFISRPPEVA
jgi:GcrA cell cycle regulator